LLRDRVLADFSELWPQKFTNVTNGVTPRRFMQLANPGLADLITATIGEGWLHDLNQLKYLEPWADDPEFRAAWQRIKQQNKHALADQIRERTGVVVNPHAMFDVMVKRLHEYKRQLLKVLHAITVYNRIKAEPHLDVVPRVVYFGAKAAPGYQMAKLIIKLINAVAVVVNNDPDVHDKLKIVFPPNFNVTLAERIYPAADLSEQISLAGKEASGTGNMKFALNGAVTIGTLDGANIEIRDLVGPDNFFLFGLTEEQVTATQAAYTPRQRYEQNAVLKQVLDQIAAGVFSPHEPDLFRPIVDGLLNHDPYMLLADYQGYVDQQDQVGQVYRDVERWTRMSILNTARCGYFSSDRSVHDYATQIWQVNPVDVAAWRQAQTTRRERYARRMAEALGAAEAAGITLTDAEWELLTAAPVTISSAMMTVTDSGLIGTVLEDGAVARAPAMTARRYGANPLVTAVLVRMKEQMKAHGAGVRQHQDGLQGRQEINETLQRCTAIADVLEHKIAVAQAEEFKRWLVAIGEQVAQAAMEGGFVGIGGQAGNNGEAAALDAIRTALRVKA
jgi:hypothetical protein